MAAHDSVLVVMSVLIAMFASYTALDLSGRVRASSGWARQMWLGTAAVAMGGGIWSMHFVAMLAHSMPDLEVAYDLRLTVASLVVAIAVTGLALARMDQSRPSIRRLLSAGLLMGLGVVAMHYMGMAAMRMPADLHYDRLWVAISVLIAVGAATAALWLASLESHQAKRVAAAMVMGVAISGMHFAGMRAASFEIRPGSIDQTAGVGQTSLAVAVFAATFVLLFLALTAALFDRRFALLAEREAAALRSSEERFRALYRGTPLPLYSLDHAGCLEQVSDAWLALLGYEREPIIGHPLANFMTAESANRFQQGDWDELLSRGSLNEREYKVVTSAGALLDVLMAARVERNEVGEIVRILGGLTDVTDRKQAEAQLVQAQKNEAIGHLTGGIAHDFNNLLAIIIGNLDILKRRMPEDPRTSHLVANALEGAERGAALTQRLLSFARRQDLRPQATDIPQLVRGMTNMLQRSLGPQILVENQFPADLPPALVDAHQLELALLNIAVNARDAMPEGGRLAIRATSERLSPSNSWVLSEGDYLRLSVRDEGVGMDEATLTRATDPFFTTKAIGKGTGLGLSMVHGLAAQSGGQLVIDSAPGAGTTVDLYLPAAAPRPDEKRLEAPRTADLHASKHKLSILVVDDEPLVLENTAALIEEMGHFVRLAASGSSALAQLAVDPEIDVLVTDQMMPGMTGTQLAHRVQRDRPRVKVLIVSGYAEIGDAEKASYPILRKPFDGAALDRELQRFIVTSEALPLRLAAS